MAETLYSLCTCQFSRYPKITQLSRYCSNGLDLYKSCTRLVCMAESWAARLAPEPFRDFLPYTSASALKVIHVKQVLSRALSVAQHVGDESARARVALRLQESLRAAVLAEVLEI